MLRLEVIEKNKNTYYKVIDSKENREVFFTSDRNQALQYMLKNDEEGVTQDCVQTYLESQLDTIVKSLYRTHDRLEDNNLTRDTQKLENIINQLVETTNALKKMKLNK